MSMSMRIRYTDDDKVDRGTASDDETCKECGESYELRHGQCATVLCDSCAQDMVDLLQDALDAANERERRLREALDAIARVSIIPPTTTEQARQLLRLQDMAFAALTEPING